ncbi:MAG: MerR family transcriptional regulator [bacterium]
MVEHSGEKLFYSIGEISELTQVKPYVLRYWESEFDMLHPVKGKNGQRIFKGKDLEAILEIKELLYSEGYTIAGAKKKFKENKKNIESQKDLFSVSDVEYKKFLTKLKKELEELNELLSVLWKGDSE